MKFEQYELKEDKYGFKFAKHDIMLGEDGYCIMCGKPTKFVEIFAEQHFCSDECVKCFYEIEENYNNAYYDCKLVADSIVDEESYQKADKGLVMFYIDTIVRALGKQIRKKPRIWEHKYPDSPVPNDNWGYECPCCGNQDIDYPEHHCICGQALDWGEEND